MKTALQTIRSRGIRPAPALPCRHDLAPAAATALGSRMPGLDPGPAATTCDRLLDDAAIIDRVNRGDEQAAQELVARLRPTVLKCVRRRIPRWASEEDLVQTAFGKVFAKLHQFSGSVPLEHWVSRIAINTCLNQFNHEATRPELRMSDLTEEQEAVLQNRCAPDAGVCDRRHAGELIHLLLGQLTADERRIIVLLHLEQRSTREISRMTGLSVSLVKVKAFRTRHKMQRLGRRLLRETASGSGEPY
jgi:RNA polymerase sigma factor (sigma-70 family)